MERESRTMSISHKAFLLSLEPLKRYYPVSVEEQGKRVVLRSDGLVVEIRLNVEQPITLGALSMPSMKVDFSFPVASPEEKARFWSRFELCFRRGGG